MEDTLTIFPYGPTFGAHIGAPFIRVAKPLTRGTHMELMVGTLLVTQEAMVLSVSTPAWHVEKLYVHQTKFTRFGAFIRGNG